jgi:glutaredoxin-related protein
MKRDILDSEFIGPEALAQITNFHSAIVKEVQDAVKNNKVVVVGMAQNPVVKKARKALTDAGVSFEYLEYGSYFKGWKARLAIKLWSGWPTYPQVFVNGKLIGGCAETIKEIEQGKMK